MSQAGRKRGPTSWDVARLAGVSQSTVSLVLAGKAARRVGEETRAAVLDAAESLGYRPNSSARALKLGSERLVALAAPNVSNPYFAEVLKAVASAAGNHGYTVALVDAGEDPPDGRGLMRSLAARSFDGLIVWESPWSDAARAMLPETVVVADSERPDGADVFICAPEMMRSALDHLGELGHRRFARLGFDLPAAPFRARARAFRDWLGAHDIAPVPDIEEPFGATASPRLAAALGGRGRPTAVVCDDDLLAPLVYRAARQAGLRIPEDVSVVGIGDIDLARLLDPPLTTVAIPAHAVGMAAFDVLMRKIEGGGEEEPVVIATGLVARGSSATFRPGL